MESIKYIKKEKDGRTRNPPSLRNSHAHAVRAEEEEEDSKTVLRIIWMETSASISLYQIKISFFHTDERERERLEIGKMLLERMESRRYVSRCVHLCVYMCDLNTDKVQSIFYHGFSGGSYPLIEHLKIIYPFILFHVRLTFLFFIFCIFYFY